MKEASGEANMTVITILLIAIVGAVGTAIINSVMKNTSAKADCSSEGGTWFKNSCCYTPTVDTATGKITGCADNAAK